MQPPSIFRGKLLGMIWLSGGMLVAPVLAEPVSFNREIRPLLSDRCFACHGFDAPARKGDLRLDTAEGAYAAGENGAAIVPGDLAASTAWQRITTLDPEDQMPPPDSHLKLAASEKVLIRRWIEEGATYEPHWALQRVVKPTPPTPGAPLDAFISQRLAKEGLKMAPEASKATLIRRLSLDLRGISPSAEEVTSFVSDAAPDAFEKWVDRFLADPAYGERMAWPWLDAARYADSNGFQGDADRTAWPWRDWVVSAFNRNLPFDEFTIWQLAGDLLPNPTEEQILATGFLRNHPINGEGGRIPEENRVDYVMDMAETTGTVWMGLTFNCCRCHDHKYDPLTQRDYYSLFAFFNQTPVDGSGGDPRTPPVIGVANEAQRQRQASIARELETAGQAQAARAKEMAPQQPAWEAEQLARDSWQILTVESVTGIESKPLADGSILTLGENPVNANYTVRAEATDIRVTAIRLDALLDPSMTGGGIARSDSGNFVLSGFELTLLAADGSRQAIQLADAAATFEQGNRFLAKHALDADPLTGWAIYEGRTVDRNHAAIFRLAAPLEVPPGARFEFTLRHESPHPHHNLGRFRLAVTGTDQPAVPTPADIELAGILSIPTAERSPAQIQVVEKHWLQADPKWQHLAQLRQRLSAEQSNIQASLPKVMVMADRQELRTSHVLAVGAYDKPLEEVSAATPPILPPLTPAGPTANRLDLARWLVSRDHPLTARVTVNRIWQEMFGVGLVTTPENFGVQSELPEYPELLDWLAADFMESGWDLKHLIRTIVTSRTYRQSSRIAPEMLEKDPANRLLARGPRFRLPSWMIRDQALASSGLLVSQLGGQPVKPYQPENLWPDATFGKVKYIRDTGDALYRRSLYTFWRRISMPPMFFDNAKRDNCSVNPSRTNTPLHALFTLNDVTFVEAARVLAARSAQAVGNAPSAVLNHAFATVLGRDPDGEERAILLDSYRHAHEVFATDPDAAKDFLAQGDSPVESDLPATHLAALAAVSLAIFNFDEVLTKE
jgi:hypothetical protein